MRVLVVKTSSLGDVIHTLPALSDARRHFPQIEFDWLVEERFAEIPAWHPAVATVIPVSFRAWRRHPWRAWRDGAWAGFKRELQARYYDCVIDAQGLLKSAFLAYQAYGARCGLDWRSAREPLASLSYQRRYCVPRGQHAVTRVRRLFAAALGYTVPEDPPDYGLQGHGMTTLVSPRPSLVFLHGTTWPSKHWPEPYWAALAERAAAAGFRVRLPWGSEAERERAQRLAEVHPRVSLMPASTLQGVAAELSVAQAVIGVDSGLAHLAAALNVPSITLYGPTQAAWTGTFGRHQAHLQAEFACAPCLRRTCAYPRAAPVSPACYMQIPPEKVWNALCDILEASGRRSLVEALGVKLP